MSYFEFKPPAVYDFGEKVNLEYLVVNSLGAYSSSSLPNLHTRKYHGLFVVPQPKLSSDNHVLLSCMDEAVVFPERTYELAVHRYPGTLYPEGHLHLRNFRLGKVPVWLYGSDDFQLEKSLLLLPGESRLLIRYKILEAGEQFHLRFMPFLAFRNAHHLRSRNEEINGNYDPIAQGIRVQPYEQFDPLCIQFSREPQISAIADWYYNFEYSEERNRGYDFREDLFVPLSCAVPLKKGEQLTISIATVADADPERFDILFREQLKGRTEVRSWQEALAAASKTFIIDRLGSSKVIAGWHWFGSWGRDSFISLPGLYLGTGDISRIRKVLSDALLNLRDGLFSNADYGAYMIYNSVDAPLWFFWTLQKIRSYSPEDFDPWKLYGDGMRQILNSYRNGTRYGIHMTPEGLITAGEAGKALTWMDAIVEEKPVTPRTGMPVEVNALWYNAVNFALELALEAGDLEFAEAWKSLPMTIKKSFQQCFWDEDKGYLADVVDGEMRDLSIRPNMLMAVSLPYSPLERSMGVSVLEVVKRELLTPRGLRTLSVNDPAYIGRYEGDQETRDRAYHQGSVWPWLMGQYAEAALKIDPERNLPELLSCSAGFEQTLWEHGIGTVSEIFDGYPPHLPRGAVSQAWSVAELIRTGHLLEEFQKSSAQQQGKQKDKIIH